MKISVVIPTYRRPALLTRCIEALTRQAFSPEDFEIVVVTDGPDKVTAFAITTLDAGVPLRVFSLPQKGGPAAARNFGWQRARGKLIAFTDDDCIPSPTWLKSYWRMFRWMAGSRLAFTGRTQVPLGREPTDYERNVSRLSDAGFITANCACTKSALEVVGGFDERFTVAWREDSDLYFRLLDHEIPVVGVHDAVVTHPVRKASWGVSLREERKTVYNALLYKKFPIQYRSEIQPNPPWHYHLSIIMIILVLTGWISGVKALALAGFVGWLTLTSAFTMRRLSGGSHTPEHVAEMVITSALLPVVSLYWRLYGSWKFKIFFFP